MGVLGIHGTDLRSGGARCDSLRSTLDLGLFLNDGICFSQYLPDCRVEQKGVEEFFWDIVGFSGELQFYQHLVIGCACESNCAAVLSNIDRLLSCNDPVNVLAEKGVGKFPVDFHEFPCHS